MSQLQVPPEERRSTPLWRNLSFTLMWTSTAASGFGDRMIQLAAWSMLGINLVGAQGSSIQAAISFWFFLPYIVLSGIGGWLADTLPRRFILFGCDAARAVILLAAMLMAPTGAAGAIPAEYHWKVYLIIAAVGSMAAIFSPTRAATIPQIVPTQQLQPANAIVLGMAVIASLIGLLIGGPVVARSVKAAMLVGAVTFGITGTFFLFMKLRPSRRAVQAEPLGQWQRMLEAVTYTWSHRRIRELVGLNILFWAGANILIAAVTAMCKQKLGIAPDEVITKAPYMIAAIGAGMLCSSLWVAWINTRRESSWFAMFCLLLTAVFMAVLAANRSYNIGLVLSFAVGFFGNAAMIVTTTLIQSIAADFIRGRVFGVRELLSTGSAVVVNFFIWRTPDADTVMIPALMVTAAVLALVALRGLWAEMTRGPMPSRVANVFYHFVRAYALVWHRVHWIGRAQLPMSGPVILAANHTTGLDPFLMQTGCTRMVRWVMIGSYKFPLLKPMWDAIKPITVNQDGKDLSNLRQMLRVLGEDQVIGIFPEGGLQRELRQLQPFAAGIGLIAARSGAYVVPVWIDGTPMVHSMWRHFLRPSRSTVVFGVPYKADKTKSHQELADELRGKMLSLAAEIDRAKAARVV
ncbi:MAG: MFS transporter [Planctomycetes bacterium]|nr:MFS transporter [Planctomycetota bacterium]